MSFAGFPGAGLEFLRALEAHNEREWFEAHRAPWDEQIVPAMLSWLGELHQRLRDTMPSLTFVPRVGGSLFRPTRDTRFGKDKRPYHAYAAGILWDGSDRQDAPCLYLQVSPAEVLLSGGIFLFEEARLDRYRKALADEDASAPLDEALRAAELAVEGELLPRPPRPFHVEGHPRAELARRRGLCLVRRDAPAPWLFTREALDRSEAFARAYAPLHRWMIDELFRPVGAGR